MSKSCFKGSTYSHKVHFLLRRFGDGERQPSQLKKKKKKFSQNKATN